MLEEEVSSQTKSIWEHIKSFFFNLKSRIISFFSKKAKDGKLPPAIQSKVNNLDNKLKQTAPNNPETIKQTKKAIDDVKEEFQKEVEQIKKNNSSSHEQFKKDFKSNKPMDF